MREAKKSLARKFSKDILDIYQDMKRGHSNLYEPDKHIPLLLSTFSLGDDVASFCTECNITRATFYNWVHHNPDFADAYEHAKERSRHWFEVKGKEGMLDPLNFNPTAWSMQMRNRFGYTDKRQIKIKGIDIAVTHSEKLALIWKAVSEGQLTADEAVQITNLILAGVKIDESTTMKIDVELLKEHYLGKAAV